MFKLKSEQLKAADAKKMTPEMAELVEQIQSDAIKLVTDLGELISQYKRLDPEYKKEIEKIEQQRL